RLPDGVRRPSHRDRRLTMNVHSRAALPTAWLGLLAVAAASPAQNGRWRVLPAAPIADLAVFDIARGVLLLGESSLLWQWDGATVRPRTLDLLDQPSVDHLGYDRASGRVVALGWVQSAYQVG